LLLGLAKVTNYLSAVQLTFWHIVPAVRRFGSKI